MALAVLLHTFLLAISATVNGNQTCGPSSYGEIRNISNPFRLEGDPSECGDPDYELVCKNNRTMIKLGDGKYYVANINYHHSTIRVVDPGVKKGNCLSTPLFSAVLDDISITSYRINWEEVINTTVLMKCEGPISDGNYIPITPCNVTSSSSSYSSSSQPYNYVYALVGGDFLLVNDLKYSYCTIISRTFITQFLKPGRILSMSDLQEALLLGFDLSFFQFCCESECKVKRLYCDENYGEYTIQCGIRMIIFIFIHSCIDLF